MSSAQVASPEPARVAKVSQPRLTNTALLAAASTVLLLGPLAFGAVEPWSIFALEVCATLLLLVWAFRQWTNRELTVSSNVLYRPMAAFFALGVVQWVAGTTAYRVVTYTHLLLYAASGMLVFVVTQTLRRSSQFELLAKMVTVYGAVVASFAVLQEMCIRDRPNIPRNLSFALVLGVISGVGLAFLLENMDNTVRTPEQAQAVSALPSLGMIPLGSKSGNHGPAGKRLTLTASKEVVETVTLVRPQSQMAESYRALRTSLLLSNLGAPPKVIMVTSARPQEGKTTTSINTAIVLAQKGVRVLLIDADLRRPSVHKTLGMGPRSGLSNVLTGSATVQQTITTSPILANLFIMPAGTPPPNPAELLASANMKDLVAELRQQFDHIVIDTPPTLSVTDAVVLSPRADATILVIRSGQTTKQALRRARDILMQVNAHVAGVLLNAVDLTSPDYYYYYEYQGKYSHYYQEEPVPNTDEPKAV